MGLFEFILLWAFVFSFLNVYIHILNLGHVDPYFFKYSLLFLELPQCACYSGWYCLIVPLDFACFFFFFLIVYFLFLRFGNSYCPFFTFCWFFFPSPKICFWVLSVNISFQLLYFSAPIFILLGRGSGFLCLYWYFCFGHASFSWFSLCLPLVLWASLK